MFKKLIVSKALRRRVNWIIAAILILPFVLFFHTSLQSPIKGAGGIAGELFGKPVSWETFQRELQWVRTQWESRFEGDLPEGMDRLLAPSAWERLMLLAEAKRLRLGVSDRKLAEFIQQLPPFQENGRFVPERYRRYLAAIGTNPQAFEELLRHDLLIEQLLKSRKADVAVTDDEILSAYQQAHERVRVSLILRDLQTFRDPASRTITEDEVRARYDAHPEEVQIPAQITLDYLGLTTEELRGTLTVPEEEMADYYAAHPEEFQSEDNTTKPLDEVRESIRQRLLNQQISRRLVDLAIECEEALNAKASFEDMAARTQLAIRTVGPVPLGSLGVPNGPESAVLEAAFSLEEGAVSRVVETDNGVYVVRVSRREPMRVPPLEEVRHAVVERLIAEKAREGASADAEALYDHLQGTLAEGVAFEEACHSLGVAPLLPAPFTRTEPIQGVGLVPSVNAAAFAASPGQLTEVLDIPSGSAVVLVHERLAADAAGLTDEERARLKEQLVNDVQQIRLAEWLEEVRARAKLKSFLDDTTTN
jgi:peptidyl-prolyl cis-trans isomerase D